MKPQPTEQQIEAIKSEIKAIIDGANIPNKIEYIIQWNPITNMPMLDRRIVSQLHGRSIDKYVTLLNRCQDGRY